MLTKTHKPRILSVLDLGSTKVICLIARIDPQGSFDILGVGHQVAAGMRGGVITDLQQAEKSIRSAVGAAEQMAGFNVDRVVINISDPAQYSHHVQAQMAITGQEITPQDVKKLVDQAYTEHETEDRQIMHTIILDHIIDQTSGIENPEGMTGDQYSMLLHIADTPTSGIYNAATCLAKCHLDIENYISTPYASAIACLDQDEQSLGTLVLDFGGATTSMAVMRDERLLYTHSIPCGGMHVTNDLAIGLSMRKESAERIKVLHGQVISSVRDEQELIDIPQKNEIGKEEIVHIKRIDVVEIIRPRMEEILEIIRDQLSQSGLSKVVGSIVLTGGGSQLRGLNSLVSEFFNKQTRLGLPRAPENLAENAKGPGFSTALGMIYYMAKNVEQQHHDLSPESFQIKNNWDRFKGWVKALAS